MGSWRAHSVDAESALPVNEEHGGIEAATNSDRSSRGQGKRRVIELMMWELRVAASEAKYPTRA